MKNIPVRLHYGFISQTHLAWQLLPKGEALPVYVWDFRKWKPPPPPPPKQENKISLS